MGEETIKFATIYKVTQRRIQQLYDQYERTGNIPVLKSPGRKKKEITKETIDLILKENKSQISGALILE